MEPVTVRLGSGTYADPLFVAPEPGDFTLKPESRALAADGTPPAATNAVSVTRVSTPDQNVFFGYYDVPALDPKTGRHLAHRVPFRDRLPTAADEAELGTIALDGDGTFRPFAKTRAWNFQQGSMLQWLGDGTGRVFYNEVRPDGKGYRGVLHDLKSGRRTHTDRALANVSRDGRWMLYDSYPDAQRQQRLFVYDLRKRRGRELGQFYSLPAAISDFRCDLHPRWLPDGRVSFDSTHEGHRGLYLADVRTLVARWDEKQP